MDKSKNEGNDNSVLQVLGAPPLVPSEVPTATITLTAEGTQTVVSTSTAVATQTGTPVASGTPGTPGTPNYLTPMVATHVAYATRVAIVREGLMTSVALTHAPTTTPGRPAERPSPTPMLGMLPGCSNTNTYEPQAISCWRGVVDGQLVDVSAGREGRSGDVTQGIIKVHVWGQQGMDIYQTPDRVGAVRIVSVNGMMFTLETIDQPTPQEFVFDLANRRWVSP